MSVRRALLCVSLLSLAPLGSSPAAAESFDLDKNKKVLEPVTFKNLTLFPVVTKNKKKAKDYVVLDRGMKSGVVKVHETNRNGTVLFNMACTAENETRPSVETSATLTLL